MLGFEESFTGFAASMAVGAFGMTKPTRLPDINTLTVDNPSFLLGPSS